MLSYFDGGDLSNLGLMRTGELLLLSENFWPFIWRLLPTYLDSKFIFAGLLSLKLSLLFLISSDFDSSDRAEESESL